MAQETRAITADERLRMPDDGYKYELVEGRLRKMTPAGSLHGVVGMRLASAILADCARLLQYTGAVLLFGTAGFNLIGLPSLAMPTSPGSSPRKKFWNRRFCPRPK